MAVSPANRVDPGLADELLALPTLDQRAESLRESGLLNPGGLEELLDLADGLLDVDPGRAGRLAELCADLAGEASAPAAVPRANYVRAGAHSINGEFAEDLRLTAAAREGYVALGMNLQALRTDVGKTAALLELGRYDEALAVGRAVLAALDGGGELEVSPSAEDRALMTALVHQNLGGCLEFMGRYDEALDAYAVAEERYRALGMDERAGEILDNRGTILSQLGRAGEALAAHESAARVFEEAGSVLRHAKALANVGEARRQLADYARALEAFGRAGGLYDALDARADKSLLLLDTANAHLELNLYPEALAGYREAAGTLGDSGMTHNRARALWGAGAALVALSDLDAAEEALADAVRLFEEAGNAPMLSKVLLEQAALLEARGDREGSLALTRETFGLISRGGWPVQNFYARLRLADLSLPDTDEAEAHLTEARRLAEGLALPHLAYRLDERLGRLRRLQGRDEEARSSLEAAVEGIERLRGAVAQDAMRVSFLRDKTTAYEDLLRLHLDLEDPQRAFAIAEKAKSRALEDLLVGGLEREPVAPEEGAPQAAGRINALQADLNATYNRLLGETGEDAAGGGVQPSVPRPVLRGRAVELEEEIGRLRLRAAARVGKPSADPFATDSPARSRPRSRPERERLPSDAALVAYHVVGDEVVAFVEAGEETRVARSLGSVGAVSRLLRRLDRQWNRFRLGEEFVEENAALLERSARIPLASLYEELVAPLEGLLGGAPRELVVVPHGPLHRVPFHALFDGERYLLERSRISYAPSARVHALCREKPDRLPTGEALAMGVADGLAPSVTQEVRAVGRALGPEAEVLEDGRATLGALREKAPGRGVLHLACHGLFRHDNPMFSSLKLHDGWLTAAEILRLDLEGALVVLSACDSGRSRIFEGDELIGLTRAFLGAGAATLVSSLWAVQDETTARLMGRFYEGLRGGAGPADSLREAQLALKEEHPHPYHWAPFVLVGKR